ncbi:MAG: hypothetical protein G01um101425_629 [Candidatus Peregrinibacteria bacterium Gr01-1014_25]|nr:MAG: hypothetical protein G01um101425_629 [Candidatus Peregrinibacteria bacterium Gr01-1014_25]
MRRLAIVLGCSCLLLSACSGDDAAPLVVRGSSRALIPAILLSQQNALTPQQSVRPAVTIGIYSASTLGLRSALPLHAVLQGIDAQLKMLPSTDRPTDDAYAILAELGATLEVDITDYLNRSTDRAADLDRYTVTLRQLLKRAGTQHAALTAQADILQTQERDKRRVVNELDRTIRAAVRDKNFAIAGAAQEDIAREKAALAELEAQLDQAEQTASLLEDVMEIGEERLSAIEQNREILVAGLRVVDVPGVEELDLIDGRVRRSGSRRTGGNSVF